MRIFDGKVYRDMTPEEIEAMNQHADPPNPTPTIEDRLAKVEEDSTELKQRVEGLETGLVESQTVNKILLGEE